MLKELCFGALRFYPRLQKQVQDKLKKPFKDKDFDIFCDVFKFPLFHPTYLSLLFLYSSILILFNSFVFISNTFIFDLPFSDKTLLLFSFIYDKILELKLYFYK